MSKLPIVLGVTGASGAVYGLGLLEFLLANNFQVELVYSENAREVAYHEVGLDLRGADDASFKQILQNWYGDKVSLTKLNLWHHRNIAASISSGSYKTQGMIIAPASMGTIANIAAGTSNNLVARAADVVLKERRKLVLVARETPLSSIHLRNMLTLSEMGAVVLPAAPGFYQHPKTIQDQVNFVIGKTIDAFGLDHGLFTRWSYMQVPA